MRIRRRVPREKENLPRLVTPLDPHTERWKLASHPKFPKGQTYLPMSNTQKRRIKTKFASREARQTYESGSEEVSSRHYKGKGLMKKHYQHKEPIHKDPYQTLKGIQEQR